MATHSSILAWEIPWTEEPGGLEWDTTGATQHCSMEVFCRVSFFHCVDVDLEPASAAMQPHVGIEHSNYD